MTGFTSSWPSFVLDKSSSPGNTGSSERKWDLEAKIWGLGVLISEDRVISIYMYIHISIYVCIENHQFTFIPPVQIWLHRLALALYPVCVYNFPWHFLLSLSPLTLHWILQILFGSHQTALPHGLSPVVHTLVLLRLPVPPCYPSHPTGIWHHGCWNLVGTHASTLGSSEPRQMPLSSTLHLCGFSHQHRHPACSEPSSSFRSELFWKGRLSKRRERPEEMF